MMQLNERITVKELNSSLVLLNLDNGHYYTLNETAAIIFKGLMSGKIKDDIISGIAGEYNISVDEVESDYNSTLSSLIEMKILQ